MNGILSEIAHFNQNNLKPTSTRETTEAVIVSQRTNLGHGKEENIMEYQEEPSVLKSKVKQLAQLVRESKYMVAYTGAGISTSAKIPDYRGPQGIWTLRDKGVEPIGTIDLETAIPTFGHMSLVALLKKGYMKHLVSTNTDGLHLRSGIPTKDLSELHGNCYSEVCDKCKFAYLRPYSTCKIPRQNHYTGRSCEQKGCDGKLRDNIIHFGETLPIDELTKGEINSRNADLALVCGTSMLVTPACELPTYSYATNGGKMVICNKQKTRYDEYAAITIHADLDDVFYMLMDELGMLNDVPTVTPEGYKVTLPNVDSNSLSEKYKSSQLKMISKEPVKKSNKVEMPTIRVKQTQRFEMIGGKGKSETLSVDKNLLYIANCENCEFWIPNKVTKVVIDRCSHTTVHISGGVLTGCLELINSNNMNIYISVQIPTITIDMSYDSQLIFYGPNLFKNIITARVDNTSIKLTPDSTPYKIPCDSKTIGKDDWESSQFITRMGKDSNDFDTQKVLRIGGGYVSTFKDNQIAEEKEKRNQQLLQSMFSSLLSIKAK